MESPFGKFCRPGSPRTCDVIICTAASTDPPYTLELTPSGEQAESLRCAAGPRAPREPVQRQGDPQSRFCMSAGVPGRRAFPGRCRGRVCGVRRNRLGSRLISRSADGQIGPVLCVLYLARRSTTVGSRRLRRWLLGSRCEVPGAEPTDCHRGTRPCPRQVCPASILRRGVRGGQGRRWHC